MIIGPAIYQFQKADDLVSYFWVGVLFFIALIEGQNILTGWESPAETGNRKSGIAELKPEYVNGDLGFDPLGLKPDDEDSFNVLRTKELQNGRLAMLGVAGIVAQELVNGKGVIENLTA
jgi:light-harvesting complex I chlorophyll a/b binding protein 1